MRGNPNGFQEKYPHLQELPDDEDDFQLCCELLSWLWIYTNWKEGTQSTTRYGIYRQTAEIIAVTRQLLGQKIVKTMRQR